MKTNKNKHVQKRENVLAIPEQITPTVRKAMLCQCAH